MLFSSSKIQRSLLVCKNIRASRLFGEIKLQRSVGTQFMVQYNYSRFFGVGGMKCVCTYFYGFAWNNLRRIFRVLSANQSCKSVLNSKPASHSLKQITAAFSLLIIAWLFPQLTLRVPDSNDVLCLIRELESRRSLNIGNLSANASNSPRTSEAKMSSGWSAFDMDSISS